MSSEFEVAGLKVEPGTRQRGYLRAGPYFYHKRAYIRRYVLIPFTVVRGVKDGPTLVQTAGCHPTEYSGIDATIKLSNAINPEELTGTFIGVPCMNIPGFWDRSYINPIDGKNMQGLFPGRPDGTISEKMAYTIFNLTSKADYHIDCHGGCIHESNLWLIIFYNTGEDDVEKKSEAMVRASGIKYLWYIGIHKGALGFELAKRGIPAVTYELNTGDRLLPEESSAIFEGTSNIMRHLGMLEGKSKLIKGQPATTEDQEQETLILSKSAYFTKGGLFHTDVKTGDLLNEGQVIGTVTDLWGELVETIHAPATGRVLGTINNPLVRPGDGVLMVGVRDKKYTPEWV